MNRIDKALKAKEIEQLSQMFRDCGLDNVADKVESMPTDEAAEALDLGEKTGDLLDQMVQSGHWSEHLVALLACICAADAHVHGFPKLEYIYVGTEAIKAAMLELRKCGRKMKKEAEGESTEEN